MDMAASPLLRCGCGLSVQAIGAIPRGGSFDWLRASLAAHGATVAFALHGGFRADLFAGPGKVLRHRHLSYPSRIESASRRTSARISAADRRTLWPWPGSTHSKRWSASRFIES